MKLDVPFYPEWPTPEHPEGVHCLEMGLKMILGFFDPNKEYSTEELEKITAKQPEKGSWEMPHSIWFAEHGYEIKHYSTFDYQAFKEKGIDYIREAYGEEVSDWQRANSDIEQARSLVDTY